MISQSPLASNKQLDSLYGSGAPANLKARLWLIAPALNGTGGSEVSGGGYVPSVLANNPSNFPAASGGIKSSASAFTFPISTGIWGTVVACSIHDALTNDLYELVQYGSVAGGFTLPPIAVLVGQIISINIGDFSVQLV